MTPDEFGLRINREEILRENALAVRLIGHGVPKREEAG